MFYRGSQEVIGASKMDEKLLEEIRRQEAREAGEGEDGDAAGTEAPTETTQPASAGDEEAPAPEPVAEEAPKPSGQQTLMGFGSDA